MENQLSMNDYNTIYIKNYITDKEKLTDIITDLYYCHHLPIYPTINLDLAVPKHKIIYNFSIKKRCYFVLLMQRTRDFT